MYSGYSVFALEDRILKYVLKEVNILVRTALRMVQSTSLPQLLDRGGENPLTHGQKEVLCLPLVVAHAKQAYEMHDIVITTSRHY